MGNSITELASYVQPLCEQFFNLCQAAGIPVLLVDTGRTITEQEQKLANGVSWTQNSKHLPQPPEGLSEAFDVCPKEYLTIKNWCPGGPLWAKLGDIGESLGLRWGGRWLKTPDPGHFEYVHPTTTSDVATGELDG